MGPSVSGQQPKAVWVRPSGEVDRPLPQQPLRSGSLLLVEPFDQQDAIKVIELVLEHSSFVLLGLDRDLVAIEVVADEMHPIGAGDLPGQPGNAETALFEGPLAV